METTDWRGEYVELAMQQMDRIERMLENWEGVVWFLKATYGTWD